MKLITKNKDAQSRVDLLQYELRKQYLRSVITDLTYPPRVRFKASILLSEFGRGSFSTRLNNLCIITGRGRSVLQLHHLSRLKFKEWARAGKLPGVQKSSW
jgi:small subunit ribosomal protein S14